MRIYILEYKLYLPNGGSYKYAENSDFEKIQLFYKREKRSEFIEKYQWAKKESDLTTGDVRCYVIEKPLEITDRMDELIDAL